MLLDAVVVAYNSRDHLRACVEPLARIEGVKVFVADNASTDDGVATIEDLPVEIVRLEENGGFGTGCNAGARLGNAPLILFLNPDATIDAESLQRLAAVLEDEVGEDLVGAGRERRDSDQRAAAAGENRRQLKPNPVPCRPGREPLVPGDADAH